MLPLKSGQEREEGNIGTDFKRSVGGKVPICSMSDEEFPPRIGLSVLSDSSVTERRSSGRRWQLPLPH